MWAGWKSSWHIFRQQRFAQLADYLCWLSWLIIFDSLIGIQGRHNEQTSRSQLISDHWSGRMERWSYSSALTDICLFLFVCLFVCCVRDLNLVVKQGRIDSGLIPLLWLAVIHSRNLDSIWALSRLLPTEIFKRIWLHKLNQIQSKDGKKSFSLSFLTGFYISA